MNTTTVTNYVLFHLPTQKYRHGEAHRLNGHKRTSRVDKAARFVTKEDANRYRMYRERMTEKKEWEIRPIRVTRTLIVELIP